MRRDIFVVTAAYGRERLAKLGGQMNILPLIAAAGADGDEIRRELLGGRRLSALAKTIADNNLKACYSAPEPLFTEQGRVNPLLPSLLQETRELNARWIKLPSGNYHSPSQLAALREIITPNAPALVIENDQTPYSRLANIIRLRDALQKQRLSYALAFDMANWLWVDESPELAAENLRQDIGYIHVKAATAYPGGYRAIALDEAEPRWLQLFKQLPATSPCGIEFPLEGHDLLAVTRHYIRVLREV